MFILASSSARRLDLLKQAYFTPDMVLAADIDETPKKKESPSLYCKRMALEKCQKISALYPEALVLSADTIVTVGSRILGKPNDAQQAKVFLKLLSGRQHRVYTSVAVMQGDKISQKQVCTFVSFKRLTQAEIDFHTCSLEWEGKSGGYMIQGLASTFVKKINGSVTNVIGLPLTETASLLKQFNQLQKI